MSKSHIETISHVLNIQPWQVENVVGLLDEGATIPFIARYRKEKSGSLDEVAISDIRDRIMQMREIDKRRGYILKTIEEQGHLTPELKRKIEEVETLHELEDLYLPYKPKRRTRATVAREKGLEPLARKIYDQLPFNLLEFVSGFIDEEKDVKTIEEALQGSRDIMAEWISEDAAVREKLRHFFWNEGILLSKVMKGKEEEGEKFRDYFAFSEKLSAIPSHRLLALRRGEKEMVLSLDIQPNEEEAIRKIEDLVIKSKGDIAAELRESIKDAYKRLLKPSMETEARLESKKAADTEAIKVFAENLKQLLLASPLGQKRILAVDPGFRTGCKVVCLDRQGKLLENTAIYPNEPQKDVIGSAKQIKSLIERYQVEAIAVGNGTASRETESFLRSIGIPTTIPVIQVNESGASIYSASEVARMEFPDHDVTVRGAVSIGRRLMDPLAELVKIDAKSIGVGQYQHDVDQAALKKSLDDVVSSCVNAVGVELNTASRELLSYVSGLGPQLANNIVSHRNANGPYRNRESLREVARMGNKAFEQCAGFLRIHDSDNPLDKSAVHPERYGVVQQMAHDKQVSVPQLLSREDLRVAIDISQYVTADMGIPTLKDILKELDKPGRDPRDQFEVFEFNEHVKELGDLRVGMELPGIITNITKFGAFVDIGVHQDGLVHVSQMANRFISDPSQVVKINQKVQVRVIEVDISRKRISLTMKQESTKNEYPAAAKKDVKKNRRDQEPDMKTKLDALRNRFK